MPRISDPNDKYYIDNPGRVKAIQSEMARRGIDVYLGSRIRTMSFVMDTFCPWRSYLIIPPERKAHLLYVCRGRAARFCNGSTPMTSSTPFRSSKTKARLNVSAPLH